jgi:hybrid cluster-associated redox disulfide protein
MHNASSAAAWLDLPVADVLDRWPATVRTFLDHRMACLGCQFNTFDTLREALAIHQVATDAFLADIQRILGRSAMPMLGSDSSQGERS